MPSIRLDVAYYDDKQRDLILKQTDVSKTIQSLVANGLTIDAGQFFVNAAYKYQQDSNELRTRDDLKRIAPEIYGALFTKFFDISEETIRSNFTGQNKTDKNFTEICGVGATLSVINSIYGLIEPDWERIDISGRKDLDFRTKASDGKRFILTECRGRIVDDLDQLSQLSDAKKGIIDKKSERRKGDSRDIYMGVIAAFSTDKTRRAKCRLVDPPIESVPTDPRKYKLLARMSHYHRELNIIAQSRFLIALSNRIQGMSLIDDYKQFDNVALINGLGEPFKEPISVFSTRSVVVGESAFGEVIPLGDGNFYFYGFVREIHRLMISQSHEAILSYRAPGEGVSQIQGVIARVPKDELLAANIDIGSLRQVANSNRLEIIMSGELTTTSGGHVLGVVKAESSSVSGSPKSPKLNPPMK